MTDTNELFEKIQKLEHERDRLWRYANGFVDYSEGVITSNVDNWKQLQEDGYFENHPNHRGLTDFSSDELKIIRGFRPNLEGSKVVVIGCGYGRDVAQIAPHVSHVYGIDVNDTILNKASKFLGDKGIKNFTPVLVDNYANDIPDGIDLVFCFVVFQHLTRDLTRQYIQNLSSKLSDTGIMVLQFLETMVEGETINDARLENYEPSVSWNVTQIHRMAFISGADTVEIKTVPVGGGAALWHWACLKKKGGRVLPRAASAKELT